MKSTLLNFAAVTRAAILCASLATVGIAGSAYADSFPAVPASAPSFTPTETDYRLGSGDKIRLTVFGEEDLSGEFQVDGNGFVRLPLIGQIKTMGLNAHELEASIRVALANGYLNDPRVNVEVTTYRPFYILGEVNRPGEYPYVNGMTVPNAIALAGGYTSSADDEKVFIREDGISPEVRMRADQTVKLHPGDVVRVSKTTFWTVVSVVTPVAAALTPLAYIRP